LITKTLFSLRFESVQNLLVQDCIEIYVTQFANGEPVLAQVVERLPGKEAAGSNPVRVTTFVFEKVICELCNINFYTILNLIVGLKGYYSSEKTKISFKKNYSYLL
jgi:hypothetical protein